MRQLQNPFADNPLWQSFQEAVTKLAEIRGLCEAESVLRKSGRPHIVPLDVVITEILDRPLPKAGASDD